MVVVVVVVRNRVGRGKVPLAVANVNRGVIGERCFCRCFGPAV